jgi:phytoene dehydrogenase-like protein
MKCTPIVIGGGHNGLTAAAISLRGAEVLVLERRHVLGSAAVTEEIFPGFKFRLFVRLSLLRPGSSATSICRATG